MLAFDAIANRRCYGVPRPNFSQESAVPDSEVHSRMIQFRAGDERTLESTAGDGRRHRCGSERSYLREMTVRKIKKYIGLSTTPRRV